MSSPEAEYAEVAPQYSALAGCSLEEFTSLRAKDLESFLDSVANLGHRGRFNKLWTAAQGAAAGGQGAAAAKARKVKPKGRARVRQGAKTLLRGSSGAALTGPRQGRSRARTVGGPGAAAPGHRRARSAAARPKAQGRARARSSAASPAPPAPRAAPKLRAASPGPGAPPQLSPSGSHESTLADALRQRGRSRAMSGALMDVSRERNREEEAAALTAEVAEWTAGLVGNAALLPEAAGAAAAEDFCARLASGADLCRLLRDHCGEGSDAARACARFAERAAPGSFPARDNVTRFLAGARFAGVPEVCLFETEDLLRGDAAAARRVVNCLLQLARVMAQRFGVAPPLIVRYELEIDTLEAKESLQTILEEDEGDDFPRRGNSLDADVHRVAREAGAASLRVRAVKGRTGLYRLGAAGARVTVAIRNVRGLVMVRVGGGWEQLAVYCQRKLQGLGTPAKRRSHRVTLNQAVAPASSGGRARASSSAAVPGAPGARLTNIDGRTATLDL